VADEIDGRHRRVRDRPLVTVNTLLFEPVDEWVALPVESEAPDTEVNEL
jgi:hypothetical protein